MSEFAMNIVIIMLLKQYGYIQLINYVYDCRHMIYASKSDVLKVCIDRLSHNDVEQNML